MSLWKGLSSCSHDNGNTTVNVHEHSILVDGTELSEGQEVEKVMDHGNTVEQSTLRHTRRIND